MSKKVLSFVMVLMVTVSLFSGISILGVQAAVGSEYYVYVGDAGCTFATPVSGGWDALTGLTGYNSSVTKFHPYISNATAETLLSVYAQWKPTLPEAGRYEVYIYLIGHSTSLSKGRVFVNSSEGIYNAVYDNSKTTSGWYKVGNFNFGAGSSGYVRVSPEINVVGDSFRVNCAKFVKVADNLPFTAELKEPTATTSVNANTNVVLQFSKPLNESTLSNITLTKTGDTQIVPVTYTTEALAGSSYYKVTMDPVSRLKASTQYTVTIGDSVCDVDGNLITGTKSWTFTTGVIIYDKIIITTYNTAPLYTEYGKFSDSGLPGYGTGKLSRYTTVADAAAVFIPNLTAGRYNVYFFRVKDATNGQTMSPLNIYHKDGVASFKFNGTVSTGQDAEGWVNYGTYNFNEGTDGYLEIISENATKYLRVSAVKFEKIGDTIAPNATLVAPIAVSDVPLDTAIRISFNEPMESGTVSNANVILKEKATGTLANYTTGIDETTKLITITPTGSLKPGMEYEIYLEDGLTDAAGNAVNTTTRSWSFTTYPFLYGDIELVTGTGAEVTELVPNSTITARISIGNYSGNNLETVLIAGLYDSTGALYRATFSPLTISDQITATNSLQINLPNISLSGYKLKLFVWNSFEGMKPLTAPRQIQ